MPETKDLTLKQRKFLKLYFQTGNATQSALQVYDTDDPGAASVIGAENLAKLREPIKAMMESRGISLGRLLDVLDEGLQANKVLSAMVIVKKDSPTSQSDGELPPANSRSTDFIEVPDHLVRHKYLETAAKWLGIEGETSSSVELREGDRSITFKISRGE